MILTKSISPMERKLMELYANNYDYQEIQEIMNEHFPDEDLSGKKLGYMMSDLRKDIGCESLFSLGYRYCHDKAEVRIRFIEKEAEKERLEIFAEGKKIGYNEGFRVAKYSLSGKDRNFGVNIGIIGATIFWLAIYFIISPL